MFLERRALGVAARVAGLSFIQKQDINNNKKEIIKEFRPKIKAELPTISEMVLTHFSILYYVFMRSSIISIEVKVSTNSEKHWGCVMPCSTYYLVTV